VQIERAILKSRRSWGPHGVLPVVHIARAEAVTTPNGLIFHYFGPMEGDNHDITMYREAGMVEGLASGLSIDGIQYCLEGDKAYLLRPRMSTRPYHTYIVSRCLCGCECLNSRTLRQQGGWYPHPNQQMSRWPCVSINPDRQRS